MPGVLSQDAAEVAFAEDQHPVGDLGPGGEHESFRVGVRPGSSRRDLERFDTSVGQDCIEGSGELPGPVSDQEPEARGSIAEIHQEVPDLLGAPRPVRVRSDPEDVHVAATDLYCEEAVQSLDVIVQPA